MIVGLTHIHRAPLKLINIFSKSKSKRNLLNVLCEFVCESVCVCACDVAMTSCHLFPSLPSVAVAAAALASFSTEI